MTLERLTSPATELFLYGFDSELKIPQVRLLKEKTGMIIGDVQNPLKDTPGSCRFANSGSLMLERFVEEPSSDFQWYISAFTHHLELLEVGEAIRIQEVIKEILPQISTRWAEQLVHQMLIRD